jgi:hypothetical protein
VNIATRHRSKIDRGQIPPNLPPIRTTPEFYTYFISLCERECRRVPEQFEYILGFYAKAHGLESPPPRTRQ